MQHEQLCKRTPLYCTSLSDNEQSTITHSQFDVQGDVRLGRGSGSRVTVTIFWATDNYMLRTFNNILNFSA